MTTFQRIEDHDTWSKLLDKASFKTFFHLPAWEKFLEKELSWIKFEHYMWKDEFLLSLARCRLFGKEKLVSHPLCEYGGPLPRQSGLQPREGGPLPLKTKGNADSFVQDFQKEFGLKARIKFHPYIVQCERGLTPLSAGSDPDIATFFIENFSKKTPADLWQGFRKTLRHEIKRSEQHDIAVEECQSESELEQFYKLYMRTTKRHKNIPLPISVFRFFQAQSGDVKIYFAKHNGKVIGGSVFLFYKPFIHYFISASDERFRGWNIGHGILWHVMQKYAQGEYGYFDFGGTRKGSSLEVFKRGWGAKEYPVFETGARTMTDVSGWKRMMLGMLPALLMERFAPYALYMKA